MQGVQDIWDLIMPFNHNQGENSMLMRTYILKTLKIFQLCNEKISQRLIETVDKRIKVVNNGARKAVSAILWMIRWCAA